MSLRSSSVIANGWALSPNRAGLIVKLDDVIRQNPGLNPQRYQPVLESSYMEYPDNSDHKVALPQKTDVLVLFVRKDLVQGRLAVACSKEIQ